VPADDEIQNALIAIHSRLGTIEGKVNLAARANRGALLAEIEQAVRKEPLIGQIYLLLDGKRSQVEIVEALGSFGITVSQPTVSRRMNKLITEHGIADLVEGGNKLVLRKDSEAEKTLNLSRNVRKWLGEMKETIPEEQNRRPRRAK
jgi:DNA-binding transcriptional ArsR family regulator